MNPRPDAARRIHDASVELGAYCDSSTCLFDAGADDAYSAGKAYDLDLRARAFTLLSTVN
jgi:hypothetical protein